VLRDNGQVLAIGETVTLFADSSMLHDIDEVAP